MSHNKEIEKLLSDSPNFSNSPEVDKLYDMFLRMLQEFSVLREELYSLKTALKQNGLNIEEAMQEINDQEEHVTSLIEQHREMLKRIIKDLA